MSKLPSRLESYSVEADKRFTYYREYADCITNARKSAIPLGLSSIAIGIGIQFIPESSSNKWLQYTKSYGIVGALLTGFLLSAYKIGIETKRCQDMWHFLEIDSKEFVKENKK